MTEPSPPSGLVFVIHPEKPGDDPVIETLHARAFGPGRFTRTAFRIRENAPSLPELARTCWLDESLLGSVRFSAIRLGGCKGALLGPLAVEDRVKNKGAGKLLVREGLKAAEQAGLAFSLLVGDAPYYGPLGFLPVPFGQITLPGPVDPARLLVAPLNGTALSDLRGMVSAG